ncbi:hypothetical protein GCM10009564_14800 [Streptomyces thermogriseus]|uniref:Uncharacterized protein n=1 Tax=Streptomyces thermogriseus TaxID=75292 RepID=A0ABP4DH62_9ACTN
MTDADRSALATRGRRGGLWGGWKRSVRAEFTVRAGMRACMFRLLRVARSRGCRRVRPAGRRTDGRNRLADGHGGISVE